MDTQAMRCVHCSAELSAGGRFCPSCGKAVPTTQVESPADDSITASQTAPGVWNWVLLILLGVERLCAWFAFPLDDPWRNPEVWEKPFLLYWGIALWVAAGPFLAFRKRLGGWLAFLSGLALAGRACVPMLAEKPASGAVWALMVASATLTFAFLYEQSYWPRAEER
jgi:hypothetical protein